MVLSVALPIMRCASEAIVPPILTSASYFARVPVGMSERSINVSKLMVLPDPVPVPLSRAFEGGFFSVIDNLNLKSPFMNPIPTLMTAVKLF